MLLARSEGIYLDHHATTPVDPRVAAVMCETLVSTFGNPNSIEHVYGSDARGAIDAARIEVATLVGAEPTGVRFTSGATEAIHLALRHAMGTRRGPGPLRVLLSPVEHHAVLDALETMRRGGGVQVSYLTVDRAGRIDLEELRDRAGQGVDLICVMAANNEVGTVYPIEQVAGIAADHSAAALVDATQAAGRMPLDVEEWGITYLTLSAHKMYGPKGVGALVVGSEIDRSGIHTYGTPNVPGIAAMGEAARLRRLEMDADESRIELLRDRLERLLGNAIRGLVVNGASDHRLRGNLHVSLPDVPSGAVLARLYDRVAISSGSACMSGADAPSHVLVALGLEKELVEGALRIGVGKFTTDAEITRAAEVIAEAVDQVRTAMRLAPA